MGQSCFRFPGSAKRNSAPTEGRFEKRESYPNVDGAKAYQGTIEIVIGSSTVTTNG